jgi:molecular chaperone DnaK
MEAVAMGAAIQGAIISGDVSTDILLVDVTPLTLGLEVLGGVKETLIERNTTIPTKKSKVFTTAADYQSAVTIHVVQGERPMATDCVSLGTFNLSGIPPAPRGVPQIEVTFDIDANGILNVTAKDLGTSKEAKITITANTKLSKEEIERLKKESEQYQEADNKKKEEAELRNEVDNMIYSSEKLINEDLKDKIKPEQKEKVNKSIQELRNALSSNNTEERKNKIQNTKTLLAEISTEIYRNVGTNTSGGPTTDTSQESNKNGGPTTDTTQSNTGDSNERTPS